MGQKKKQYPRKIRQCVVCHCALEDDELGRYCTNCREVLSHLSHLEREECQSKTPAEELAEREARIKQHQERIFAELTRQGVKR